MFLSWARVRGGGGGGVNIPAPPYHSDPSVSHMLNRELCPVEWNNVMVSQKLTTNSGYEETGIIML